eukprot:3641683-Pyramimonas_sp.AAC.1
MARPIETTAQALRRWRKATAGALEMHCLQGRLRDSEFSSWLAKRATKKSDGKQRCDKCSMMRSGKGKKSPSGVGSAWRKKRKTT